MPEIENKIVNDSTDLHYDLSGMNFPNKVQTAECILQRLLK
jgi:hypothetical protein